MKYPDKAGCGACFGFVIFPTLTTAKPKDSPSGNQFEVATSGGTDNSAFCTSTMLPNNIIANSTIIANTNDRILFSFPIGLSHQAQLSRLLLVVGS
jgi:hypothetical protein